MAEQLQLRRSGADQSALCSRFGVYLNTVMIPSTQAPRPSRTLCEMRTLAAALDCLSKGEVLEAADILTQRFKALEVSHEDQAGERATLAEVVPEQRGLVTEEERNRMNEEATFERKRCRHESRSASRPRSGASPRGRRECVPGRGRKSPSASPMSRGTARDYGHRTSDGHRIRLRSRSPTPVAHDEGRSPRRGGSVSPGEKAREYSPDSPVARPSPERATEEDDYYEQYTEAEVDDADRDRDGARGPAWKAPRELKRRLWFQKKKLAKEARKMQGRGRGGGRRGSREDGRPPGR
jgi:hypothetical protein